MGAQSTRRHRRWRWFLPTDRHLTESSLHSQDVVLPLLHEEVRAPITTETQKKTKIKT